MHPRLWLALSVVVVLLAQGAGAIGLQMQEAVSVEAQAEAEKRVRSGARRTQRRATKRAHRRHRSADEEVLAMTVQLRAQELELQVQEQLNEARLELMGLEHATVAPVELLQEQEDASLDDDEDASLDSDGYEEPGLGSGSGGDEEFGGSDGLSLIEEHGDEEHGGKHHNFLLCVGLPPPRPPSRTFVLTSAKCTRDMTAKQLHKVLSVGSESDLLEVAVHEKKLQFPGHGSHKQKPAGLAQESVVLCEFHLSDRSSSAHGGDLMGFPASCSDWQNFAGIRDSFAERSDSSFLQLNTMNTPCIVFGST